MLKETNIVGNCVCTYNGLWVCIYKLKAILVMVVLIGREEKEVWPTCFLGVAMGMVGSSHYTERRGLIT